MHTIKKIYLNSVLIIAFFFFTSLSYAVPGQLIYGVDNTIGDQNNCSETLSTCRKESENLNSLYKTCQLQKSQLGEENISITSELSQEKKKTFALELGMIAIIVSSAVIIIFLKKTPSVGVIKQDQ